MLMRLRRRAGVQNRRRIRRHCRRETHVLQRIRRAHSYRCDWGQCSGTPDKDRYRLGRDDRVDVSDTDVIGDYLYTDQTN